MCLTSCQRDLFCCPPEQLWHRYLSLYEHPQPTSRCSRMTACLYIEKLRLYKPFLHNLSELWFIQRKDVYNRYCRSCVDRRQKKTLIVKLKSSQRSLTSNIIDNDSNRGISDITWYQTSKPFLPGSIPVPL